MSSMSQNTRPKLDTASTPSYHALWASLPEDLANQIVELVRVAVYIEFNAFGNANNPTMRCSVYNTRFIDRTFAAALRPVLLMIYPITNPDFPLGVEHSADLLYLMLTHETEKYFDAKSFFTYLNNTSGCDVMAYIANYVLFVDLHGDIEGSVALYVNICYNILTNLAPKAK